MCKYGQKSLLVGKIRAALFIFTFLSPWLKIKVHYALFLNYYLQITKHILIYVKQIKISLGFNEIVLFFHLGCCERIWSRLLTFLSTVVQVKPSQAYTPNMCPGGSLSQRQTHTDWTDRVLTWVVAHISVSREPGDVITFQHGGVPLLTVLAIVKDVVHGCSGHVFDCHFTLKHSRRLLWYPPQ